LRAPSGWLFLLTLPLVGQQPQQSALLSGSDLLKLADRCWQLVEATSLAIPDLNRSSAPLQESLKQARTNLRSRANHTGYTYSLLTNLRAYASLVDAAQKPYPLPGETMSQLVELKGTVERLEIHFRSLLENAEARLRPSDRDNLRRFEEANQKLGNPAAGNPRVVFFGDSITDFWRLNEYFQGKDYVNRGISGQVTSEMLGRFKADVIDLKPVAVVILAGTNDLARNTPISTITSNYTMMAELAKAHGIKVIFASVLPVSDYHKATNPDWERSKARPPASIVALNDWLKRYTSSQGHIYLDYFSAVADNAGMLKADMADDGLHPNAAGYRAMAPLAQAAIDEVATGIPQPPKKKKRLFTK
jgi:acyl-CoA thioesterase-1